MLPKHEEVLEKSTIGDFNLVTERQSRLKERLVPRTEPTTNGGIVIKSVLPILGLRYTGCAKQLCDTTKVSKQLGTTDRLP